MPGGGHDDVTGGEAVGIGIEHCLPLEALHGFFGSKDGFAEGMILPEVLGKDFVNQVIGIVLVHFDLFEDYSALTGDVLSGERRMQDKVGEDFKRDRNI